MAFDFKKAFADAMDAGLLAAKPGGEAAEDWIRQSFKANEQTLSAIAEAFAKKEISKETAEMLLSENGNALKAEAAALAVIIKASAQAAVNAFFESLSSAFKSALKLAF